MSPKNFIDKYFDIAKKIYSVCIDELNLKVEDARLYVYIYVKSVEDNNKLDYFKVKNEDTELVINNLLDKLKNVESYYSQLDDRYKIHTDENFRKEKIAFYIENILPKIIL